MLVSKQFLQACQISKESEGVRGKMSKNLMIWHGMNWMRHLVRMKGDIDYCREPTQRRRSWWKMKKITAKMWELFSVWPRTSKGWRKVDWKGLFKRLFFIISPYILNMCLIQPFQFSFLFLLLELCHSQTSFSPFSLHQLCSYCRSQLRGIPD